MRQPLQEAKALLELTRKAWAYGFGVIIALVIGIALGMVIAREEIIDDCRYASSFRVHTQVFTCQRKL